MKIGIISDTHGHEGAWTRACEKFFTGADLILHAGDVAYHGPRNPMKADYNPMGLIERINASEIPVVIAKGNCDSDVDASCLTLPILSPYAYVFWEGRRGICAPISLSAGMCTSPSSKSAAIRYSSTPARRHSRSVPTGAIPLLSSRMARYGFLILIRAMFCTSTRSTGNAIWIN